MQFNLDYKYELDAGPQFGILLKDIDFPREHEVNIAMATLKEAPSDTPWLKILGAKDEHRKVVMEVDASLEG